MTTQSTQQTQNPRRRGGQPGNQNARTHGYYSHSFTPEQHVALHTVIETTGEDPEVAALLLKITAIISQDPVNIRALRAACSSLLRLLLQEKPPGVSDARMDSLQAFLNLTRPRSWDGSRSVSLSTVVSP